MTDKPFEALQAFENALNLNPADIYSLTNSHSCLILTGRLKKASQYIDRILKVYPNDILALKRKAAQLCCQGLVRKEQGKYTRKLINKIKKISPQAIGVHESQAIYFFYRSEHKKGLHLLKQLAKEKPNSPYYWYHYGCWLYRTGFLQSAADAMIKVFTLYTEDTLVFDWLCEILPQVEMKEKLRIITGEMLKRFPDHWSIVSQAGLVLAVVYGEMQQAHELLAHAVCMQPKLAEVYSRQGRAFSITGKHKEALEILHKGWQLLPEDENGPISTPIAWLIAQNFKMTGDIKKAEFWWEKTLEQASKLTKFIPAQGYFWRGQVLHQLKDFNSARQALRHSLSLQLFYPQRRQVKDLLRQYSKLGIEENTSLTKKFT